MEKMENEKLKNGKLENWKIGKCKICKLKNENGKVENALESNEKIIGSWLVKKVVTDYNNCSWGTDEFNHYNSYDPSDGGYWHYFINIDGTFTQEWSTNNNLSEDTLEIPLIFFLITFFSSRS